MGRRRLLHDALSTLPRRRTWVGVAAGGVLIVVAVAIAVTQRGSHSPAPTHRPASQTWASGVFAGYGPSGDQHFAAWRGAPLQTATDFISAETWAQIADPMTTIDLWRSAPNVQLVLSVPMWPTTGGGTLAAAATGAYNPYFASLARSLVAANRGTTIVRIGWEFNTTFYRWAVRTPTDAALYAEAWRQMVTSMRSVPGQHFGFVWTPNSQPGGLDPALSYPGDGYVTDIGLDVYDQDQTLGQSPQARWSDLVNKGYGLAWQASFAASRGKPIAFPEWGEVLATHSPGLGGGDNPYFITQLRRWFGSHHTAFEDYFDSDTKYGTYYGLTTGSGKFPTAARTYRALWSGTTSP
jgi:hypothetical protein